MKNLNIGIIGTGSIAVVHLTSLKEIQTNQILEKKHGVSIKIKTLIDSELDKELQNYMKKAFQKQLIAV